MVEPLRHRQTKGAATDMFYLQPPRHISTLPFASIWACPGHVRYSSHRDRLRPKDVCKLTFRAALALPLKPFANRHFVTCITETVART